MGFFFANLSRKLALFLSIFVLVRMMFGGSPALEAPDATFLRCFLFASEVAPLVRQKLRISVKCEKCVKSRQKNYKVPKKSINGK